MNLILIFDNIILNVPIGTEVLLENKKTVLVLSHDPAIIKGADKLIDLDKFQNSLKRA